MKAEQHFAMNRLICYYYKSGKQGKSITFCISKQCNRFTFCTSLVGGIAPNPL